METQPTPVCHIVTVPYPGCGHINPIMNLCKTIATEQPNILITFVVTQEWFGLIGNDSKPGNIIFATIPNVVPSEHVRARDFVKFFEAVMNDMENPFEQVVDRISHPPSIILADALLFWAVKVGKRRNIPVALFNTSSVTAFKMDIHTLNPFEEDRQTSTDLPVPIVEKGSADQPAPGQEEQTLQHMRHAYTWVPKAQYILHASVQELEQEAFDAIKTQFSIPLYTVGPNIPYSNLEKKTPSNFKQNEIDYLQWLDSQLSNSVLYISFGSFLSIPTTQRNEIAAALCASGVPFLWAARDESTRLTKIAGRNGIVIPWCDQLRVLTHCSIGGFWTHYGWGSVMEGLFAGVPFLASPIGMDQDENCKLVVEDWKVGWRVNTKTSLKIEGLVHKFMDQQDDESRAMRKRAKGLQEICQQAIRIDGSSQVNINAFISEISQGHGY